MAFRRNEADNDASKQDVAKWPHILGGCVVLMQFYVFASLTLLLLSGWVALEALAGYLGGGSRWAIVTRGLFRRHYAVLQAFWRSLRLRKHAETQAPLSVEEVPELFAMLESLCFLLNMASRPAVFLEMEARASFQHGRRITLGIGFDLLPAPRAPNWKRSWPTNFAMPACRIGSWEGGWPTVWNENQGFHARLLTI